MDDISPQASPSTQQDNSLNHVEEGESMIGNESAPSQSLQEEDQSTQHHFDDHDVDPKVIVSTEEKKCLDESEITSDKTDHDGSYKLETSDDREALIDTSAPIESVKDAASKFGGVARPKAHLIHIIEKSRNRPQEQGSQSKQDSDLESTNRLIEELKVDFHRVENEEREAKQDLEILKMRVKVMEEQENVDADMLNDDEQMEYKMVMSQLKLLKKEVDDLKKEYESLLSEKETALERVEKACSGSKEINMIMEAMELELVFKKEALESAKISYLEAEENIKQLSMDMEKEKIQWDQTLEDLKKQVEKLDKDVKVEKELKEKMTLAFDVLRNLKSEFLAYEESKSEGGCGNEVNEWKVKIEGARDDLVRLNVECVTLKRALEHEITKLVGVKKNEGRVLENIASLERELEIINHEIEAIHLQEEEREGKMVIADQEANDAKSIVESARERLSKVREEAEEAKSKAQTLEAKIDLAQAEMDVARVSAKRAMNSIKEVGEREATRDRVRVSLEEYDELNKQAHETVEKENIRVARVMAQVEAAKEDQKKSLRKIEEANEELLTRKEVYEHARNKAEKENAAKIVVEEEFRKLSRELGFDNMDEFLNGQDGRESSPLGITKCTGRDSCDLIIPQGSEESRSLETSIETKLTKKKKKKHFFPHFYLLFWKKKAESHTPLIS